MSSNHYADRLQKTIQRHVEETMVVPLGGPLLGPDSDFPQKVEIVHGGQRFETARLAAVKRQADAAGAEGEERDAFVKILTGPGKPKEEMLASWRAMLLETVVESGIVQRIGWVGPRYNSKNRAKKWVDGSELELDGGGEKLEPPTSADIFEKEPESWRVKEMPGSLATVIGLLAIRSADISFPTEKKAEAWRADIVERLTTIAKKSKADARGVFDGTDAEFKEHFQTSTEGVQYESQMQLIKQCEALEFVKAPVMWSVPENVFLDEHQVDDPEVIKQLLEISPEAVLSIYRARFHWENRKRQEKEELAKNS